MESGAHLQAAGAHPLGLQGGLGRVDSLDAARDHHLGRCIVIGHDDIGAIQALEYGELDLRLDAAMQVELVLADAHLARDLQFLKRFRAEARLSARLAHPNIVGALDFGRMDDNWFFAMEFVDGPTLKDVAEHHRWLGEPVKAALVAHIGREILSGLEFAHAVARDHKGRLLRVVHRDLSPSNLLIDRSGQVKISDFGVARALRRKHDLHTHHIVGKPAYMAPEQLKNGAIDARFDLFSVGVVLWELVCNRRLFLRDSEAATMMAVLACEIPRPSQLRPELGTTWDAFFVKALAEAREDRFASAAAMSDAIAVLQDQVGVPKTHEIAVLITKVSEDSLPELEIEHTGPLLEAVTNG